MAYITKQQSADFRKQIKAAFPVKAGWKFSVTIRHHSTIRVALMQYPAGYIFPDDVEVNSSWIDEVKLGKKEKDVFSRINEIVMAGNHDNSDAMTDYFDVGWYVDLSIGKWDTPAAQAHENRVADVKSDPPVEYNAAPVNCEQDDLIIARAMEILQNRIKRDSVELLSPDAVSDYLKLHVTGLEYEVFGCLFLDNRNRVIDTCDIFRGTIDGCSVFPREIVKEVLQRNAAALILYHNHPSGKPEPSDADRRITTRLVEALALIDVRVLDHIVIGGGDHVSFAERGLI